jgi:8-amino-7-oxononanoate synthase
VIDDAHGFGVLGADGAGALSHFGLRGEHIAYMGTLGKAAGVSGAFVAGSALLADLLIQRARSYIYTTASPPALAAALLKSVDLIRAEGWRRARLADLVARLRSGLRLRRWQLSASATAIQPLIVGDNADTLRLSAMLEARAILVPAIRPPTVPKGSARLRISLSATHADADVDTLIEALHDAQTEFA